MCCKLNGEKRVAEVAMTVYKVCRPAPRSKDPETTFRSRFPPNGRRRQESAANRGINTVYRIGKSTTKSELGYYCYVKSRNLLVPEFLGLLYVLECLVPAGTLITEGVDDAGDKVILAQRLIPMRVVEGQP